MAIAGGFVGLGAAVASTTDTTAVQAYLDHGATVTAAKNLNVRANDKRNHEADTTGVSGGAVAAGASFVVINVNNPTADIKATSAYIGNDVQVGTASNGLVGNVLIEAKPDIKVDANTFGLAGGIGAASINFAEANVDNHASATIGNSDIEATGTVTVRALGKGSGKVTGTGVAAGGLAVGTMKASLDRGQSEDQPDTDNEVSAGIHSGANIKADRLAIRAYSDDFMDVRSTAGAGAVIGGAGANSTLRSNYSSRAFVGANADVKVNTLSITSENEQDLDSKSTAEAIGALASAGGAEIDNEFTGKARVDIASGSLLEASSMSISARNILDKDRFGNGVSDSNYNLVTVTVAGGIGGAGQASISDIDPTAQVNITGATLRATGTAKEAGDGLSNFSLAKLGPGGGLIEITTLVDADTIDRSVATDFGGLVGVTVADNQVRLTTRSEVNVTNATLEATEGVVQIATRTDANNSSSTEIDAGSVGSASAFALANADTTANQTVNLSGTTRVESSKIRIYTGQDAIKAKNNLYSQSRADAFTGSILPGAPFSPQSVATILERNTINVEDTTRLESYGDIDLIATRGIGDVGDRARAFGELQVVSAATIGIPVITDADYEVDDDSFNRVNIDDTATLIAGLGSSAGVHILPINMRSFPGSIVPNAELDGDQKDFLEIPESADYRFVPLQVGELPIDFYRDFTARAVAGATAGGTVGRYYRFLPLTLDAAQPVLLHQENFADTSRWEDVGTTPPTETPVPVYDSDISIRLANAVRNDFVAAQPVEFKPVKLAYRNIGNLLFERREQILQWMSDHATDGAAIARYQVELDAVESLMEEYGLLGTIPGPNGTEVVTVKKELNTLFADVPSVISAPGSIFIEASNGTTGTPYATLVNNKVLDPRAGAKINIVNRSPLTMTINGAKINDNRRVTTAADGTLLTLEPGNVYVNRSPLTSVVVTADNLINIQQTREPGAISLLNDLPIQLADVPQDLYIRRDVINEDGDITINNLEGSIFVNAEIRGENLEITAFGDINLNTESWQHARDPMQYLNFQAFRDQLFNPHAIVRDLRQDQFFNFEEEDRRIVQMNTNFSDGTRTLEQAINDGQSRLLAQGRITLTAEFLNVNGLIQSGAEEIQFGVSSDFVPPSESTSFLSTDGIGLLPGLSFGTARVPVRGYWDANADDGVGAFILEDITPKGGEIFIAGRILSTGNGQIKVANGFPSVQIDNDSPYRVHVGKIDTTKFREGRITIVDTTNPDAPTKAEYIYLRNTNQIQQLRYVGELVNGPNGPTIDYGTPISNTTHGMSDNLQYELQAGLQYVWTDGMLGTYQQTKTITTDYGFWAEVAELFFGTDRTQIAGQSFTPEFLDQRPTVESETLQVEGTPGSPGYTLLDPGYSAGSAYSLLYRRDGDARTRIDNNSLVRYPGVSYEINFDSPFWTVDSIIDPAAKVYRYVGPLNVDGDTKALVDLSNTDYDDTNLWIIDDSQNPQTFESNELDRFESWFRNRRISVDRPAPLDDDVTVLKITTTWGLRDLYTHSLKADYPIGISFGNSPALPSVNIASHGGILLTGGIEMPAGGTVELISTAGSIVAEEDVVIYGASPNVIAWGDVELTIEGDQGPLNIFAGGDIQIDAVSLDNISSRIDIGLVHSTGGDVEIVADDGIRNDSASSKIKGNRMELKTIRGALGSATSPLRIEANTLNTGGLIAYARSNIYLNQVEGDLPLLRSRILPGAASVESEIGSVLIVSAGSILDRDSELSPEDRNRGRRSYTSQFLNGLIAAGVSSNTAIAYPVSSVMATALLPNLNLPNLTVPLGERLNVRGTEVTLRAENAGSSIGYQAQNVVITNPRNFGALSTAAASTFASATPDDIVGVQYGLYRYIGPNRSNVDLKIENFNDTSRWTKLNATFATGGDSNATVQRTVSFGQRVRVEYSQDLYGMYEYLGATASLNLVGENYLEGRRWRKLGEDVASDGPNVNLTNGMLVTNKDWIDALTLRKTEDVNVVATAGLRAIAHQDVLIESPTDIPIYRTVSGGDTSLRSTGDLVDTNFDEAAVAAGGQARLIAGENITSALFLPFRTQIAPTGSLRAESSGYTRIRQLANDTTINGVAQPINNLFVSWVDSNGPAEVTVLEGDMLVGYVTSDTFVNLTAAGSILDAFPNMTGDFVNIHTPKTAIPGHVILTAGNAIGSAAAPLTVDIRAGELTSLSGQNTTLASPTHLTVRSTVSTNGSVSFTGGGDLRIDSIRALNGNATLNAYGNITDLTGDAQPDVEAITIFLRSTNGSIGAPDDDLEVNTADTTAGELSTVAARDNYVTEVSGRLNVRIAQSTVQGDVRISNMDLPSAGQNIHFIASGNIILVDGDLIIQAADNLTIDSNITARNIYIKGDHRNADLAGTIVSINGLVNVDYAEIETDVDNDTVFIAAIVMTGFVVRVAKGDDEVTAGSGNDMIFGGDGRDILRGGDGDDYLDAGFGVGDELYGQSGNDTIFGSPSGSESDPNFDDAVRFGDRIEGGEGDDTIYGLGGADLILGGGGNDVIDAGDGSDRVLGGLGVDTLIAGIGLSDELRGEEGNDYLIGSDVGNDTLLGGIGNDRILGQGGNDSIDAGDGDDYVDAGAGTDNVLGGAGNDELYAGGGANDIVRGGDGDDVIYGSNDGADQLFGDAGRDRILGHGGNDRIEGGTGDDILDGGAGDDTIYGDAGRDLIVGGANHDVLYALNPTNTGADNSVDYVYGDFGTNGNETGSGRDQLFGDGGRDLLYGEGDDDLIDDDVSVAGIPQPNASLDFIDYGIGDGADPTTFSAPLTTLNPTVLPPGPAFQSPRASYPTGVNDLGRWGELSGSASGTGLNRTGITSAPSIASTNNGVVTAWSEASNGRTRIYVAEHNGSLWQELPQPPGTGVLGTASQSSNPQIIVTASGRPTVAWTERSSTGSNILLAQWDPSANSGVGAWIALGNSLTSSGLSNTGNADHAMLVETSLGLVVAWQNTVAGTVQAYARIFNGTDWVAIGTGSDTGNGITTGAADSDIRELSLATHEGKIALAWSQRDSVSGLRHIRLREFSGTIWNEIEGSATGSGVSGSANSSFDGVITHHASPSVAYVGSELLIAWQAYSDQSAHITVAQFSRGVSAPSVVSTTETAARMAQPKLISNGTAAHLIWADGIDHLYAKRWNGQTMVEQLPGDASGIGITFTGRQIDHLAVSIDSSGRPAVAWTDLSQGQPSLMVRRNHTPAVSSVRIASANGSSIQQILDAHMLGAGDVIVVDGVVGGDVVISAADAGVTIWGAPGASIQGNVTVQASDVRLHRLAIVGQVTAINANHLALRESTVTRGTILNGGSGQHLLHNQFQNTTHALTLTGNATNPLVRRNTIDGGVTGLSLGDPNGVIAGGSTTATLADNAIVGGSVGLRVAVASSANIIGNTVRSPGTAFDLDAPMAGIVRNNTFFHSSVGVRYEFPAVFSDNDIRSNEIGVIATVNSTSEGFGFQTSSLPNRIDSNAIGVQLTGRMQNQRITRNGTGVMGTGTLVSLDAQRANIIEENQTGVDISGRIEFQRIGKNLVGIRAASNQIIAHNVLYRNGTSIEVFGRTNVRVVANTMYTPQGDHVRVSNASREVELLNNIFWTEDGYNIFVANDSTVGFFSDYNVLHTSGNGKIGFWTKDFNDILDWQEDIYRFDLNSIGRTVVNPAWSEPRFINRHTDDYRIFGHVARQRFSSPSLDAGSPYVDTALPASSVNLVSNPGFESGLTGWNVSPTGAIRTSNPNPFEGTNYFFGDGNPTTTLTQTVDLLAAGFTAAQLDNDDLVVVFGGRVRAADESILDTGTITVTLLDGSNNPIGSPQVASASRATQRWDLIGGRLYLPSGVRSIRYQFQAIRNSGATNDAYLDRAFVYVQPSTQQPDTGHLASTPAEVAQAAHLVLRSPDLYKDWERDKPLDIRWDSYGNATNSPVIIDLYQDSAFGPTFVTRISGGAPDTGKFTWIAANSGVNYGTSGLRIQIMLADNITILDRSTETFTVPENTNTFFVNDGNLSNDEFTSAMGNNRHTGKVSSAPKPYPNNVLRIYTVGANQSLSIDRGNYPLINPLVIGNAQNIGDDEGFILRGAAVGTTSFSHANPFTVAPVVELNDADLMDIRDISISGGSIGLYVRNISTDLDLSRVRISGSSGQGLLIETGSMADVLDQLQVTGNSGNGIRIQGSLNTLRNSTITSNLATGLVLQNTGASIITGNTISGNVGVNTDGVELIGTSSTPLVFGSLDLSLGLGNRVFSNGRNGILVNGNSIVAGNIVYGNTAVNGSGVVSGAGIVQRNVIHSNTVGVTSNHPSGQILENRIYNHSDTGIVQTSGQSYRNVVYSNAVGARITAGEFRNNIVYDNTTRGVSLDGSIPFINNTVHQQNGEAVRVQAPGSQIRNNVFWVDSNSGNVAILVASAAQPSFSSDFNTFYTINNAGVGQWEGVRFQTLAGFQTASQSNANSLQGNPSFVNPLGSDGVLGYVNSAQDGRDDDFHLRSTFGSFHGGSFAPVATASGTGLPIALTGTWVNDSVQSISIDAGNPADAFANEPLDNGNIINAGAYGNTVQASRSPATFLTVKGPDGGEIWVANQTFNIRWTTHNLNAPGVTYAIDLLRAGAPVLNIAANAAGTGSFLWTVPVGLTPANDYTVRVTANGAGGLSDVSNAPFSIAEQVTVYYVNDNTVDAGDWTTAPGNDLNDGLSPVTPKASIQSLLATYDFGPGDRIRVDSGIYVLGSDIVITANDAGVTIEGFHDPANPARKTVLNRNSPSRPAFELQNADGVTLDRLEITGAAIGVSASTTSDSDDVVIRNSRFITNATGVSMDTSNDRVTIQNSFFDGGSTFMQRHVVLSGTDGLIEQNQFTRGGTGGNSGSGTVMASGIRSQIVGNEVYNDRSVSGSIFVQTGFTNEASRIIIRDNIIRDMNTNGIFAGAGTIVEENTIRNTTIPSFGNVTAINSSGLVRNNVIHTSDHGLTGAGTFENNRLYNNRRAIQATTNGRYIGNRIYDNAEAISAISVSNVLLANNELYRNDLAVTLNGSTARLENNTIWQSSGHAIHLSTAASGGSLINNIFRVDNGNVYHAPQSATITASDYNHYFITGTGNIANFAGQVYANPIAWYHTTGFDKNSFSGDPLFVDLDGADNQLGFDRTNLIDYGADDSFLVQPFSTTIDAGWPLSAYHREPSPHGTRVNIGSTGNTALAASRLDPQLYVIDPNGLEKLAAGSSATIRWQSSGLTTSIPVMLVNLGSTSIADNFLADSVRIEGSVVGNGAIDTSGVTSPAPAAVYNSSVATTGGVGTKAAFQLPLPDGSYTLRLHFAAIFGAAGFNLDVVVNGVTLATNFDPFVAAGGVNRAAVLPLNVTASGGAGIRLEIVSKNAFGARIHGLEVLTNNTSGVSDPRVDLQWSNDGTTWTNIATNQPVDRFGRGEFVWNIPLFMPTGNGFRVRAISSGNTPSASDISDKPFEIVNSGLVFYINDGSNSGDTLTTAPGNDANSGKSPSAPMASLEALLRNYDLNPGDVIYVDSGIYNLANDLVIGNSDSGVRIVGPADRSAIFDRGSVASGARAFVLENADGITFENLEIRNSSTGIFANLAQGANTGSDGLTIRNSRFTNNSQRGVFIDSGNNGASVIDSVFDGGATRNQAVHLFLGGTNSHVTNNLFTRSPGSGSSGFYAVQVVGASSLIDGNQFVDNNSGNLLVGGGSTLATATRATNNIVRDSIANGIEANGNFTFVENSQVFNMGAFGNPTQPFVGLRGNGAFRNNTVHSTQLGMQISGSAVGNTVFNSILAGMWITGNGNVASNTIYSNPVGAVVRSDNPLLSNNLVYGNETGVRVESFAAARLVNNTIYQTIGNAIVAATSGAIQIENNILSVNTGTAIAVSSGNPTITGDYNAFQLRSTGNIASQGGTNYSSLTTWGFLRGSDRNSFVADPLFIDFDGPDNVLGFSGGNFGADDNFRVGTLSTTLNRGNPNSVFALEPYPNGGRIDIGAFGNTSQTTSVSPEQVQILAPNGLEKLEEGQPVVIRFQSSGLAPERLIARVTSSAATSDNWAAGVSYRLNGVTNITATTVDVGGVANPPPPSVYQSHSVSNGVGESLQYAIPVANGTYNIRLHTFEPNTFIGVGGRRFDIQLQGMTVDPNVDIRAIAGAANKAIVRTYSGIAVSNGMLDLRMLNLTGNGAVLAAIEITANEAVANPNPTVGLQYSPDLGT
ncbi:MAG: right-handed parallel beta-helix repeat-containing protein, partial [bacterium]